MCESNQRQAGAIKITTSRVISAVDEPVLNGLKLLDDVTYGGNEVANGRDNLPTARNASAKLNFGLNAELVGKLRDGGCVYYFAIRTLAFDYDEMRAARNDGVSAQGHDVDREMFILVSQTVDGKNFIVPATVRLRIDNNVTVAGGKAPYLFSHPLVTSRFFSVPRYGEYGVAGVYGGIGGLHCLNDEVIERAAQCANDASDMYRQDIGNIMDLRTLDEKFPLLFAHFEESGVVLLLDQGFQSLFQNVHLGLRPLKFGTA
ncbi:hypothetical protein [Novosphingobium sp. ES2-1]|uniref:hypothetical protein n=1 Tax=Novosphingobium sp. ES2-1 TaxID=2780074 RepID=UPI0018830270|nr:hypothetical protein [Novosphingobium sp. ES2-1]QOV92618.1 hypothetical protein IM701_07850 [Novosphingobium sp. ES2-1]